MKASPSSFPSPDAITTPCSHLRKKEMYYEELGNEDGLDGEFASDACWCSKTQEAFGPDGEPAGKTECRPGRTCYNAT